MVIFYCLLSDNNSICSSSNLFFVAKYFLVHICRHTLRVHFSKEKRNSCKKLYSCSIIYWIKNKLQIAKQFKEIHKNRRVCMLYFRILIRLKWDITFYKNWKELKYIDVASNMCFHLYFKRLGKNRKKYADFSEGFKIVFTLFYPILANIIFSFNRSSRYFL